MRVNKNVHQRYVARCVRLPVWQLDVVVGSDVRIGDPRGMYEEKCVRVFVCASSVPCLVVEPGGSPNASRNQCV